MRLVKKPNGHYFRLALSNGQRLDFEMDIFRKYLADIESGEFVIPEAD